MINHICNRIIFVVDPFTLLVKRLFCERDKNHLLICSFEKLTGMFQSQMR